ncbi:hypothetical protein RB608_12615 [Nocardioides sp. LHD-245]|uniref:hypothetical protein n=1 Tax=Nocardioides sp. LHD-245 TaxID=3051387 RepID=UPI0027E1A162|nr:hypothetical protein [Nocardioides sp. LHD-245]
MLDEDDLPETLPPGSKLLHIGMPKTGTSAVQRAMWLAREDLAMLGIRQVAEHPHERDVGLTAVGSGREFYRRRPRRWNRLATDFRASQARLTTWSSEALSLASPERVEQLHRELGPAYIVTTLRPFASQLASRWQQGVRRGARLPLDDWLRHRLTRPPRPDWTEPHRRGDVLHRNDPRRIVEHWGRVFGEDRLVFVIQDPRDRSLLLRRFEALLGAPGALPALEQTNASLPYPAAEALRHYSIAHHAAGRTRRRWMTTIGDPRRLHTRAVGQQAPTFPVRVPRWAAQRANEHAAAWADGLRSSDATVVGDLDHLVVDTASHPVSDERPTTIDTASAGLLIQACVDASVSRDLLDPADGSMGRFAAQATTAATPDLTTCSDRLLARELGRRLIGRLTRHRDRDEDED